MGYNEGDSELINFESKEREKTQGMHLMTKDKESGIER